jgi:hypothetical protein
MLSQRSLQGRGVLPWVGNQPQLQLPSASVRL